MAEGFRIAAAFVQVSPEMEGFREELKARLDEAVAGLEGRVRVTLDTADLDARADQVRARVASLDEVRAEPSVRLDSGDLDARADEARARLDELDERRATPGVGLDAAALDEGTDRAEERLDGLGGRTARPRVTLESGEFNAEVDAAEARLDVLRARAAGQLRDSHGRFAGGGAGGGLPGEPGGGWDRNFRGGGGGFAAPGAGFLGGAFGAVGPAVFPAAMATGISALLPAVGGAVTGLGLLGGVGALGLGGIGKAVSGARQASLNVGITPQQRAATAFSNSVAQQQAQDQIGQAHAQAAQDAITSARSIEQAQMNLASVERNSAEQQVQALQSVKQAQQGVEEADYSLSEAQYQLSQAWEAARENLRQLDDQLADNKLNVQQAQLAIQQAEYQQRLTDQNAYSTALDRQQAALAVAQAQQRLTDAQDQLTDSTYASNLAHKQGVAGSQQVVQAQQAVTAAQYGQADAHAQLSDAQAQATLQQLNSADQLKAAQMQLAAASEQAAFQRQQDAHNIANAEQNLTNTIREQQLQLAATESTANQAANQFAADMARLSPAAQQVVEKILGMRGAFKSLEDTAQTAIAPGVLTFLDGLQSMLPTIEPAVARMGGLLSNAFGSIGKALESSHAKDVFNGLVDNGMKIAGVLGPALGGIAGALANIGSQKGAADGLASLIGGLGGGLMNLVSSLSPFVGSLSGLLGPLGQALAPLGGEIGTLVGHLAQSLAPVLQQLLPPLSRLIGALVAGLSPVLDAIGPLLTPVVTALSAIFKAIDPLLPVVGNLIGQLAKALAPILQALTPIIQSVADMLAKELQKGLTETFKALMPLFPPLARLIVALTPIIDVIIRLAGFIMDLVFKVEVPLTQAIVWIISKFAELLSHWKDAVKGIEDAASWLWHHVFEPLWSGLSQGVSDFVGDFGKGWAKLKDILKDPVNFMINTVYTGGIEKFWNSIVTAIGQDSLKLPDIQGLASGGVLPGYAPGQDTIPAMLSPGEGVLVPEAVRAIGPQNILALNAQYGGGRVSTPGHYKGGGLIGDITGGVSSAWNTVTGAIGKGVDVARIAADVATGNTAGLNSALGKLVGTNAVGNYAKLLLGIPTTLIHDAVNAIGGLFGGGSSGPGGAIPSGQHLAIVDAALAAAGMPPPGTKEQWESGLNTLITRESGWDPRAINLSDSNATVLHDPSRGLAQTIGSTFRAYHVPGTSDDIYDSVANVASAARYIVSNYGNITNVQQANPNLPPKGYDSGGLASGIGALPKYTPLPERVLSPRQTEAFERLVAVLDRQSAIGGGSEADKQVVIHFHGTTYPNAEQMASIKREMALALG